FQAEDGIRDLYVTGVQTCALPISTGTITDDDAITASVTVAPSSVQEDASGALGTLVYTIALNHASAFATTVNYSLTGTASEGSRSEERRVGKGVDPGGRTSMKKKI